MHMDPKNQYDMDSLVACVHWAVSVSVSSLIFIVIMQIERRQRKLDHLGRNRLAGRY